MAEKKEGSSTDMGALVAIGLLIVACALVWTFGHEQIVLLLGHVRRLEIAAVSLFSDRLAYVEEFVRETPPADVSFAQVRQVAHEVGVMIRWPAVALLVAMAAAAGLRMKGDGFRRAFSLAGGADFIRYQASHWRVVRTGAEFDPDKAGPEEAISKTPLEWMRDEHVPLTEKDGFDDVVFEACERVFERQLGARWEGLAAAAPHHRALAAVFVLSAARHKDLRRVKEELAAIWTAPKGKPRKSPLKDARLVARSEAVVAPYLKDRRFAAAIAKICGKSAFANTALLFLLEWARKRGGVCATAEYRWLKPLDRSLWYGLSNAGRRAFFVEGGGIVAHHMAETVCRKPLPKPHVEEAVNGVQEYVQEQHIADLEKWLDEQRKEDI